MKSINTLPNMEYNSYKNLDQQFVSPVSSHRNLLNHRLSDLDIQQNRNFKTLQQVFSPEINNRVSNNYKRKTHSQTPRIQMNSFITQPQTSQADLKQKSIRKNTINTNSSDSLSKQQPQMQIENLEQRHLKLQQAILSQIQRASKLQQISAENQISYANQCQQLKQELQNIQLELQSFTQQANLKSQQSMAKLINPGTLASPHENFKAKNQIKRCHSISSTLATTASVQMAITIEKQIQLFIDNIKLQKDQLNENSLINSNQTLQDLIQQLITLLDEKRNSNEKKQMLREDYESHMTRNVEYIVQQEELQRQYQNLKTRCLKHECAWSATILQDFLKNIEHSEQIDQLDKCIEQTNKESDGIKKTITLLTCSIDKKQLEINKLSSQMSEIDKKLREDIVVLEEYLDSTVQDDYNKQDGPAKRILELIYGLFDFMFLIRKQIKIPNSELYELQVADSSLLQKIIEFQGIVIQEFSEHVQFIEQIEDTQETLASALKAYDPSNVGLALAFRDEKIIEKFELQIELMHAQKQNNSSNFRKQKELKLMEIMNQNDNKFSDLAQYLKCFINFDLLVDLLFGGNNNEGVNSQLNNLNEDGKCFRVKKGMIGKQKKFRQVLLIYMKKKKRIFEELQESIKEIEPQIKQVEEFQTQMNHKNVRVFQLREELSYKQLEITNFLKRKSILQDKFKNKNNIIISTETQETLNTEASASSQFVYQNQLASQKLINKQYDVQQLQEDSHNTKNQILKDFRKVMSNEMQIQSKELCLVSKQKQMALQKEVEDIKLTVINIINAIKQLEQRRRKNSEFIEKEIKVELICQEVRCKEYLEKLKKTFYAIIKELEQNAGTLSTEFNQYLKETLKNFNALFSESLQQQVQIDSYRRSLVFKEQSIVNYLKVIEQESLAENSNIETQICSHNISVISKQNKADEIKLHMENSFLSPILKIEDKASFVSESSKQNIFDSCSIKFTPGNKWENGCDKKQNYSTLDQRQFTQQQNITKQSLQQRRLNIKQWNKSTHQQQLTIKNNIFSNTANNLRTLYQEQLEQKQQRQKFKAKSLTPNLINVCYNGMSDSNINATNIESHKSARITSQFCTEDFKQKQLKMVRSQESSPSQNKELLQQLAKKRKDSNCVYPFNAINIDFCTYINKNQSEDKENVNPNTKQQTTGLDQEKIYTFGTPMNQASLTKEENQQFEQNNKIISDFKVNSCFNGNGLAIYFQILQYQGNKIYRSKQKKFNPLSNTSIDALNMGFTKKVLKYNYALKQMEVHKVKESKAIKSKSQVSSIKTGQQQKNMTYELQNAYPLSLIKRIIIPDQTNDLLKAKGLTLDSNQNNKNVLNHRNANHSVKKYNSFLFEMEVDNCGICQFIIEGGEQFVNAITEINNIFM